MLGKDSIAAIQEMLAPTIAAFSPMRTLRDRYELIDKYVAKESALHGEAIQGQQINRAGDKRKHADFEMPICHIYSESALAFYVSQFLAGYPIFGVVSNAENAEAASAMMALCGRDQIRFNWLRNLTLSLRAALRYNIAAVEVSWESKRAINVVTKTTPTSQLSGQHSAIIYSGNSIKYLDPYNLFYDLSVPISQVHEVGAFAGYIERKNYIQLKQFVHGLDETYLIRMNMSAMWKSECGRMENFYTPQIRRDQQRADINDWSTFFGQYSTNKAPGRGRYEMVTAYCRIIPKEYKISVPRSGEVQVFKFIWVNGYLIYAEPVIAGHEYLPIVVSQLLDDNLGHDTKSFVEYIMDHQDMGSSLMNASLASMRRAVTDRALYNPQRIKSADINSPVPNAKIPVRFTSYDQGFENAYREIPYHDTVSNLAQQNLSTLFGITDQATGVNRAQQGAFQKGNKTLYEYDDVMQNARGRLLLGAMGLESTFFAPIKQILKINYLQYSISEQVIDPKSRTPVSVDPVALRTKEVEFRMSDGIMPSSKLANMETTNTALGLFGQFPDLQMEYKVGDIIVTLLRNAGMTDLQDFKRTPEEQQAFAQQMAARMAPQNPPQK